MPLPALPVLGGIAQLAGGLLGGIFGSADKQKAKDLMDEAYKQMADMGMPPDLSQAILLQKFKEAGILSPEMEQEIKLTPSRVAGITEDPSLRDTQQNALERLTQVSKGGLRPEDRAAYNQLRSESEKALQGKIGQIQQGFQAKGQGGQGAELAAQLQASQEGANRMSAQGDQISADASKRALEALSTSGQMAGQVRAQDFDVARTKAAADDDFQRFNAANSMAIQSRNIAAKNAAQMQNLQNKQDIMNKNTMQSNQELARQNEAKRQYYQDQMARTQAIVKAKQDQANVYAGSAANTAQNWQSIGAGAGGVMNNMYADQQRQQFQDQQMKMQQDQMKMQQGWQNIARMAAGRGQAAAPVQPVVQQIPPPVNAQFDPDAKYPFGRPGRY